MANGHRHRKGVTRTMQETQEALLLDKAVTKDDVLRLVVAKLARNQWLFMRPKMKGEREYAIILGTIGERGGGKSGSDAVLALVEHAFMGKKLYSNMHIGCDVVIGDEMAWRETNGLLKTGGTISYRSEPLEKNALLNIDERYYRSCILIEEINVQYSNVRRFMSNTNVDFNETAQQIRKMESSLIYNVIDEMFIDTQLRYLTDIFLKTYDAAYDESNFGRKPRGVDFMWKVFPMSGYLAGEKKKYSNTKKALPPVCFHFGAWRDSYNDMKHQQKGLYSLSTKDKINMMMSVESSEEMEAHHNKWDWLEDKIRILKNQGIKLMPAPKFKAYLGKWDDEIKEELLYNYGIYWDDKLQGYPIDNYTPSPS